LKPRIFILLVLFTLILQIGSAFAIKEGPAGHEITGAGDPDLVLKMMEVSVNQRLFDDYRSVLSDSFVYVPDLGMVDMYPDIAWDKWDITKEEGFLKRLMSPVLKAELILTDFITERGMPYNQEARYEINYMLKIQGNEYAGEGLFIFEEIDKRWYLKRWEEITPILNQTTGANYTNSGEIRASLLP